MAQPISYGLPSGEPPTAIAFLQWPDIEPEESTATTRRRLDGFV
jgi:hypothetical protein